MNGLQARSVGRSGLSVSPLAVRIDGDGEPSAAGVRRAREAGVDTFLLGSAEGTEEAFARLLGSERDALVLAAAPRLAGATRSPLSRRALLAGTEEALARLGSDWIDLLLLPGFDPETPLEETVSTLDDLTRRGRVRYVGVSRFAAWQLMKALGIAAERGWARPVAAEVRYSLARRDAEFDHFPLGLDEGVGQLVRGAADAGAAAGEAAAIAAERGVAPAQVAINWALANPAVAGAIVEAGDPTLGDALGAAGWSLGEEERARLEAAAPTRQPYPQWHQINWANDRPVGPDRAARPAPQPDAEAV